MDPREFVDMVSTLRRTATALAAIDPADLPAALAAGAVADLAHAVTLADNATAVIARRIESSGVWAEDGARSAATWIAARTGESSAATHARLVAARVAEDRPAFAPAFRQGGTGVAHLTAVHRTLAGPGRVKDRRRVVFRAFEQPLAEAAAHSDAAVFRTVLSRWAAAVDHAPEQDEFDAFLSRHLVFTELGGECLIEGRLPLAEGRWLRRLLEALVDSHHRRPGRSRLARRDAPPLGPPDGAAPQPGVAGDPLTDGEGDPRDRVPRSALLCDALLEVARLAEANPDGMPIVDGLPAQVFVVVGLDRLSERAGGRDAGAPAGSGPRAVADPDLSVHPPPGGGRGAGGPPPGGPPPPPTDRGSPPTPTSPGPHASSLSRLSPAGALWGGSVQPISDAQARRHACGDAEVRRLLLDPAGVITELGRAQRLASRDQRLQVALRDGTCRFPGCRVPAHRCRPHHLVHWADGGATDVAVLVAMCDRHHRFVHEGGVAVTGTPAGTLRFVREGRLLGATRPRPAPGQVVMALS